MEDGGAILGLTIEKSWCDENIAFSKHLFVILRTAFGC